jgi:hypothetical protein
MRRTRVDDASEARRRIHIARNRDQRQRNRDEPHASQGDEQRQVLVSRTLDSRELGFAVGTIGMRHR